MSQIPANGGKKTKPPPPLPGSDPLTSSRPANDSDHARSSYQRALTSGNDAVEAFRIAERFVLNQPVIVNIVGCGWLLGTVVFLTKAVGSFTGSPVRVRYSIPNERNEREREFPNHPDFIRPV